MLEVTENKSVMDTKKSSWRDLFHEMEDAGLVDVSINGYDCEKPGSGSSEGPTLSFFLPFLFDI